MFFIVLVVFLVAALRCTMSCEVESPLPCEVRFGYLYFTFHNLSRIAKQEGMNLVFRITNVTDGRSTDFTPLLRDELEFNLFDVEDVKEGSEYRLALIDNTTSAVLWSYGNRTFKLRQDLFYCHYDEMPDNRRPRAYYINGTTLGVQWHINFWDEEFKYIEHHEITAQKKVIKVGKEGKVGQLGVFNRVRIPGVRGCDRKVCSSTIGGLEACTQYQLCVTTKFKKSSCVGKECINIKTPACDVPEEDTWDHNGKFPLNYIAVASAGGVFLFIVLISVVICKRLFKGERRASSTDDFEVNEMIEPRDCHHYTDISYTSVEHHYKEIDKDLLKY